VRKENGQQFSSMLLKVMSDEKEEGYGGLNTKYYNWDVVMGIVLLFC
jgi:hypothetical protein